MKSKYAIVYDIPGDYQSVVYGFANTRTDLLHLIEEALIDGINEFRVVCSSKDKIHF